MTLLTPLPGAGTPLPRCGQHVRVVWAGDIHAATVIHSDDWTVWVAPDVTPVSHRAGIEGPARLIWRGDFVPICVEGSAAHDGASLRIECDAPTLTTLDERARRRVQLRAPAEVSVPVRLTPRIASTWTINVSEGGVALEPLLRFPISVDDPIVVRISLDPAPVLTVGRVVAADRSEPVRVAFARLSERSRDSLIAVVNQVEARTRLHTE